MILKVQDFFLYFRDRPKMVKESKKVAKAEANLNCSFWIDYNN